VAAPQEAADPADPAVVRGGPRRVGIAGGHRPELEHDEGAAVLADTLLAEEQRSAVAQAVEEPHGGGRGGEHGQPGDRHGDVAGSLDARVGRIVQLVDVEQQSRALEL
jgi:hypothetical protein